MGGHHSQTTTQTIGYKYYISAHLIICHGPIDSLKKIIVEKRDAYDVELTSSSLNNYIDSPELFGGEKKQGGIQGYFDFNIGTFTENLNTHIAEAINGGDTNIPYFRGVASIFLNDMYIAAMNPYMKPWSFVVKRIPSKDWNDTYADINGGANPAHILYEILTGNPDINGVGLHLPSSYIDEDSFLEAAETLYNENFGLSFAWKKEGTIQELIQMVLDHIGGILYQNLTNGKFVLKLIREDYSESSLPIFDESNIIKLISYERRSLSETINEVTIKFIHPDTYKEVSTTVQDLGNINAQGEVVGTTISYLGIQSYELANRVAQRELLSQSSLLAKIKIECNREAFSLLPGDVFIFKWDALGIESMIFRVGQINKGSIEKRSIIIEALEDVFALPNASYVGTQPPLWENPTQEPADCPQKTLIELPYYILYHILTTGVFDSLDDTEGYFYSMGSKPSADAYSYKIYTDSGSGYQSRTIGNFTPLAYLEEGINKTDEIFILKNAESLTLVDEDIYAYINGEFIKIIGFNSDLSSLSVKRGVLDTVPAEHPENSIIWFLQNFKGYTGYSYVDTDEINVKLLPRTSYGTLDIDDASPISLTFNHRQIRPYPPGKFRIGGEAYPEQLVGTLTISWAHRNRLTQLSQDLVTQDDPSITPESGTTYTLKIYGSTVVGVTPVLVRTETGITDDSWEYTEQREREDGGPWSYISIELDAYRDDYKNWQTQKQENIELMGYGRQYGNYYGGIE